MVTLRRNGSHEERLALTLTGDWQRASFYRWTFVLLVVVPTLIAAVYYGLVASKRFVSEAGYVVRGVSSQRATGIDILFRTFGISQRCRTDSNARPGLSAIARCGTTAR